MFSPLQLLSWGNRQNIQIDGFLCKINYIYTRWVLCICFAVSVYRQITGEAINCLTTELSPNFVNVFCLLNGTYTVKDQSIFSNAPGEEIAHGYYQFVPVVFLLQALAFYLPHMVWKIIFGPVFKFYQISKPDLDKEACHAFVDNFRGKRLFGRFLFKTMILELSYLIHVVVQHVLFDTFLTGRFNWHDIRLEHNFPLAVKCRVQKMGSSDVSHLRILCLLPLNLFYRKIFLFLLLWFYLVESVMVVGLIYRIVTTYLRDVHRRSFYDIAKKNLSTKNYILIEKLLEKVECDTLV